MRSRVLLVGAFVALASEAHALGPGVLRLTSLRLFPDSAGHVVAVGEAENIGAGTIVEAQAIFRFYDRFGQLLSNRLGGRPVFCQHPTAPGFGLAPGQVGFFEVVTTVPYDLVASYAFEGYGELYERERKLSDLSIASLDLRPDGTFSGTAYNSGPARASFVRIFLAGYHQGTIADVAPLSVSAIEPGTAGSFAGAFERPVDTILRAAIAWIESGISPLSESFGPAGGVGTVTVKLPPDPMSPTVDSSWITIPSSAPFELGAFTVSYLVAPNGGSPRAGTIRWGDWTLTIVQGDTPPPPLPSSPRSRLFWWHRAWGALAAWEMSGTTLGRAPGLSPWQVRDLNWRIAATGDFNADGEVDLVWQHQGTGLMTVWLMNGTRFMAAGLLSPNTVSDTRWKIRAAADMTGDGKPDLLWQHETDGTLALWVMDGTTFVEGRALSPARVADTDWKIVAAADFNHDGHTDLLWQNSRIGLATIWLMRGTEFAGAGLLANNTVSDAGWRIRAVVDVNGDGESDLIWHHDTQGWVAVWIMNGESFVSAQRLTPDRVPDGAWEIVGPR